MGMRRKGREVAVQTLYSTEFLDNDFKLLPPEGLLKILEEVAADKDIYGRPFHKTTSIS